MSATTLCLWDIDGTLIAKDRDRGRALWTQAFARARDGLVYNPGGLVAGEEPAYVRTLASLQAAGIVPTRKTVDDVLTCVGLTWWQAVPALEETVAVLPGVLTLLRTLQADPNWHVTLCTANPAMVAVAKLQAANLHGFFDWPTGGYGDWAPTRADMVRRAQEQAGTQCGTHFGAHNTILLGDTPHDVRSAHGNAKSIAVATGLPSPGELRAAGPDTLLPDLSDTDRVLDTFTKLTASSPLARV